MVYQQGGTPISVLMESVADMIRREPRMKAESDLTRCSEQVAKEKGRIMSNSTPKAHSVGGLDENDGDRPDHCPCHLAQQTHRQSKRWKGVLSNAGKNLRSTRWSYTKSKTDQNRILQRWVFMSRFCLFSEGPPHIKESSVNCGRKSMQDWLNACLRLASRLCRAANWRFCS
jgi:hypothetical protein